MKIKGKFYFFVFFLVKQFVINWFGKINREFKSINCFLERYCQFMRGELIISVYRVKFKSFVCVRERNKERQGWGDGVYIYFYKNIYKNKWFFVKI